jgi:transposase
MVTVSMDLDFPEGITVTSYQRIDDAHGFEVDWPFAEQHLCQRCGLADRLRFEVSEKRRVVRDLDVQGQVSFWIYQAVFHRCDRCHHRQDLIPPFKRKDTSYTFRFEEHVVKMLIGSNEAEVARRLGISAETVHRIVKHQLGDVKAIDPNRVITSIGMDEISLKKRHKLYVTVLTDLSNPEQPQVLAVMTGKDEAAGRKCLECLTLQQRKQIQSYRVDMGASFNAACAGLLPNAQGVTDRFHVAKLWNDTLDGLRKKNHEGLQEESLETGEEGVPLLDVGDASRSQGADAQGACQAGSVVCQDTATAHAL